MMLHFYYESILHELQKGSIFRRGFLCFHGRLFTIVFLVALLLLGINFIYTRGAVETRNYADEDSSLFNGHEDNNAHGMDYYHCCFERRGC